MCQRDGAPEVVCPQLGLSTAVSEWEKRSGGSTDLREIASPQSSAPGPGWLRPPAAHRYEGFACFPAVRILVPVILVKASAAIPRECRLLHREKVSRHLPTRNDQLFALLLR